MARLLFVTNGHGESAIAARIATELRALVPAEPLHCDHFPLVGTGADGGASAFGAVVGPRRTLPSGGLVAMGNVRALARDVRAGFAGLLVAQLRFLRGARDYDLRIAVGDVYALGMTLVAGSRPVFVGTAKSVLVSPYGPGERAVLRRAARVFVRDEPTAAGLRRAGIAAEAPGNVIVDLGGASAPALPGAWIAILPGSRPPAYHDALRAARVLRVLARSGPAAPALLSVAPTLEPTKFSAELSGDGWTLVPGPPLRPFRATSPEGATIEAWTGGLGPLLAASRLAIGQAGTANEAAAAAGVPLVVLERRGERDAWYRMRQRRLLGDAARLLPEEPAIAARAIAALLADAAQLAQMGAIGR
ncbi:MAG: hypothetical protein ACREM6_13490, partial [Vulcanimicrobiaceae bacterium]